jgi:DNA-binding beta-propeller fold protein YncE
MVWAGDAFMKNTLCYNRRFHPYSSGYSLRMRIMRVLGIFAAMQLLLLLAGCGSSAPNPNPVSGIKKRVLLANQQGGSVVIMDGQLDKVSTHSFAASGADKMLTAGGITLVQDTNINRLTVFDNTTEQVTFSPPTSSIPFDIALSPDGKTAWAAVRNPGFVQAIDTTTGNVLASIPVPNAVRLVMSPQGTRLLAFSDNPQSLSPADSFFLINTANVSNSTVATPVTESAGDQPFTAVFNGSDDQVFILNCGGECGGVTPAGSATAADASVAAVDLTGPTLGQRIAVAGATAALLNGSNLFVAGTPAVPPAGFTCPAVPGICGTLQTVNTSSLTASAAVAITDGLHGPMALTSNNQLYIGAAHCTTQPSGNNLVRGCLSIVDTASSTASFPSESSLRQNFDVTSFQPISGRNVIYVVQGGELDFFDITTGQVSTTITPVDVVGKASTVLQIDP